MAEGIRIVGLGVEPRQDATLESLAALEECGLVFSDLRRPEDRRWLGRYCRDLRATGDPREVVDAARLTGGVGVAVWGHPQYTSLLSRQVQRLAREERLPCRVYPSNSPIGCLLAMGVTFLGGEEGCQGIQAYEVEALADNPSAVSPRLPLVVFTQSGSPRRWKRLGEALLGLYPADHTVELRASGGARRRLRLKRLSAAASGAAVGFIPPVSEAIR